MMDARRVVSESEREGGKGQRVFFPGWPIVRELRMRATNHRRPWRLPGDGGEGFVRP